jgi:hypothetical protein
MLSAGLAWADGARPLNTINVGAFFPTEMPGGIDANTGLALNYTRLAPPSKAAGWYFTGEGDFYRITATDYDYPYVVTVEADVTVWALTGGPTVWDQGKTTYLGAGIGWSRAEAEAYGIALRGDTQFTWELIAGLVGRPLSAQIRYRDGGVPANTGVTAALAYAW